MTFAVLLVLLSGFIHSIWNLFTKQSESKAHFLCLCQVISVLVFLPFGIAQLPANIPPEVYILLLASIAIHGVYTYFLSKAYEFGDLSKAYPIMRGMSPMLVPLIGVIVMQESLQFMGWLGISLIVSGILMLQGRPEVKNERFFDAATLFAIAVGVCITGYTVVDKQNVRYFSPVLINSFGHVGNLLALSWTFRDRNAVKREWKVNWRTILIAGIIAPGGYLLFLYALQIAPVSHVAPMREIGTVFGAFFGVTILKEQQGARRIIASILITVGVILLGMFG